MHILICDDDEILCAMLARKIRSHFPGCTPDVRFSGATLMPSALSADILLLDIMLPDTDGITLAKTLRQNGFQGALVFITGEDSFVYDAFDVQAFHYLVKPFSDEKLFSVLDAAAASRKNCHDAVPFLSVPLGREHLRVDLCDIFYAEVFNRKILLHTANGTVEYYGRLSHLARSAGEDFFQPHRSYLVHLRHIASYSHKEIRLTTDESIPISRRLYPGFVEAYLQYSKRRI